jgi:hypothetical protein
MTMQSEYAVTNYVSQADLDQLLAKFEGTNYRVVVLNGEAVTSQASLFAQAEKDLPLTEDYNQVHNWASFEDCLWNMLFSFDEERIVIVWSHVERMLEGGLEVFMTAADVLTGLARRLYEKQIDLSVFFVGTGPNFPRLQPKHLTE